MAHFVLIEDERGELIDIDVACSDYCASQREGYAGWNGCHEIEFDTACVECGTFVEGYFGAYDEFAAA